MRVLAQEAISDVWVNRAYIVTSTDILLEPFPKIKLK
jgi:hypothetical protein